MVKLNDFITRRLPTECMYRLLNLTFPHTLRSTLHLSLQYLPHNYPVLPTLRYFYSLTPLSLWPLRLDVTAVSVLHWLSCDQWRFVDALTSHTLDIMYISVTSSFCTCTSERHHTGLKLSHLYSMDIYHLRACHYPTPPMVIP